MQHFEKINSHSYSHGQSRGPEIPEAKAENSTLEIENFQKKELKFGEIVFFSILCKIYTFRKSGSCGQFFFLEIFKRKSELYANDCTKFKIISF
jgi:hypothetical protein